MKTQPLLKRFTRLPVLAVAAAAFTFAAAPGAADAQDFSRDRGARYERAQSEGNRGGDSSRSRTRSDDNSRFVRSSGRGDGDFRRSFDDDRSRFRGRDDSFRGRDDDRWSHSGGNRYRYDRDRYDSRSRLSIGLSFNQRYGSYGRHDYYDRPYYRPSYYRPSYGSYRHYDHYYDYPSYRSVRTTTYYPAPVYYTPVTRVTTYSTTYDYRPFSYDCRPAYGISYGYYPRYHYPRSGSSLSFGVRYNYSR